MDIAQMAVVMVRLFKKITNHVQIVRQTVRFAVLHQSVFDVNRGFTVKTSRMEIARNVPMVVLVVLTVVIVPRATWASMVHTMGHVSLDVEIQTRRVSFWQMTTTDVVFQKD